MSLITFEITIFKFKKILHKAKYDFKSDDCAQSYALGMFNGMDISGKEPTGIKVKPVKNKKAVV